MSPAPRLGEFDLIARYFAPLAKDFPGALGLLDDVALIDVPAGHRIVATLDAMVAGVHFLPDDPPDEIGQKLMRVNLSDLAAKGARPYACLLALCLPGQPAEAWLAAFAAGLARDCVAFGMPLIGGDTTVTPGPLTLSLTALGLCGDGSGAAAPPSLRSGALVGDRVFVSGVIGDGCLGLEVAKGGLVDLAQDHRGRLLRRYRLPTPRVELGASLAGVIHGAADVSDGLLADLGHICKASGVGARIEAARVPLSPAGRAVVSRELERLAAMLTGGDDYELVFTAAAADESRVMDRSRASGVPVTVIGEVVAGDAVEVMDAAALRLPLEKTGYRHF